MTPLDKLLNPRNWVLAYADDLYGYAYNKTNKNEVAEDLVQETFLSALKAMKSFKGLSSERTWLFAILKYKIADYYRKASTRYEVNNASFNFEDHSNAEDCFDEKGTWKESASPGDWDASHLTPMENKELANTINNCIDKLPHNQKQIVLLKMVEEEETKIICKDLNITAANYWVIIHRAKLLLRACLEKNWFNV